MSQNAMRDQLLAALKLDEGLRLQVYDDANGNPVVPGYTLVGHPTIGYGTALDVDGITEPEAAMLCSNDMEEVITEIMHRWPWLRLAPIPVQVGICNMGYQMGAAGVAKFTDMLKELQAKNYVSAGTAALDSEWARTQSPGRAKKVAALFRSAQQGLGGTNGTGPVVG